jgi:colanic acid biosynthesis glycosyl transferase WcaI
LGAAELLKDMQDIHWVIVGDGRLRPWVADEIVERQLQRTFYLLRPRPPDRMPYYFALADGLLVTLSPSGISGLTIPSKLQSYLACGRPIIGGIGGESSKIIKESGSGLVCPPGNPQALAETVLALYRMSPAQRKAMGSAGRAYFEQEFAPDVLIKKLIAWLSEASSSTPVQRGISA